MKDLKRYRKMNHFAEKNPEFFGPYFDVITQTAVDYFTVKEMPKRTQEWQMIKDFQEEPAPGFQEPIPACSALSGNR